MSSQLVGELITQIIRLPEETQELLLKIVEKLSNPGWAETARRVFGGESTNSFLAIMKEYVDTACNLPVWKTVTLPMYKTPHDYVVARRRQSVSVGDTAALIVPKMVCTHQNEVIQVYRVQLRDIGLPKGGSYQDVVRAIARMGGHLLSIELAMAIRFSYTVEEQPRNERLYVAMLPVEVEKDRESILVVARRNWVCWMVSEDITPTTHFGPDTEFLCASMPVVEPTILL